LANKFSYKKICFGVQWTPSLVPENYIEFPFLVLRSISFLKLLKGISEGLSLHQSYPISLFFK